MRRVLVLLFLLPVLALASNRTYEYPSHGFSMVLPARNPVEADIDDNVTTYTYSEGEDSKDGLPWQMDMVMVTEGVDYAQVKDIHKMFEDLWARTVASKNFDPIGPLHYSKDADGNDVATFEAAMHTETDGKKITAHFTMRYVAVVKTSRFYEISVLRNFDEKVNDFDFINSFKLVK